MRIGIKLSRDENTNHYGTDFVEMDLEEYVRGVVGSEIGNSHLEACRALAVAARTNAVGAVNQYGSVSDTSPQAFRVSRLSAAYLNAMQAAIDTSGIVLFCNGQIAYPASYSANNGGKTRSSQERWGGYRSWLIAQDDPWDDAKKVTGHRVGLSQLGIKHMAVAGKSYEDMLNFYYPNTYLHNLETGKDLRPDDGGDDMAPATVKASYLIRCFRQMVDEKWKYVHGGASRGAVDCSGAFTHFYGQAGSYMVHGSNSMWRKYTKLRGKKGFIRIVPGMAIFTHHYDGKEPEQYRSDGLGNFSHVGLYVGGGLVAEAFGQKTGCIYSKLTDAKWKFAARLKYTDYDVAEDNDMDDDTDSGYLYEAEVVTHNGGKTVNLRSGPGTEYSKIRAVNAGSIVQVKQDFDGWCYILAGESSGYMCTDYLRRIEHDADAPAENDLPDDPQQDDETQQETDGRMIDIHLSYAQAKALLEIMTKLLGNLKDDENKFGDD